MSIALTASLLALAGAAIAGPPRNLTTGCIEGFDSASDYFPDKALIEAAEGFAVEYKGSYKILTVKKAYADGPAESYLLLQCGAPVPPLAGELAKAPLIRVPIRSLFSASTTHLPLLVELGRVDALTGIPNAEWVMSEPVLARIRAKKVVEFGARGTIDVESVVASRPDLLMTGGDQSASYVAVRAAGIPVVANVEWLETSPLARAEWVKYLALFVNEEARAKSFFDGVRARYDALVARAQAVPAEKRPAVMTGLSMQGQFQFAGGRSYVARLIRDAGGSYVWSDNPETGWARGDLESQLHRAADADVWINGGSWKSRADMLSEEPRYAQFKAYRNRQVWLYDRRVTPAGANDYWSRSVTRPDLVLADLVKIFHPRLMPDHPLEWYLQVP